MKAYLAAAGTALLLGACATGDDDMVEPMPAAAPMAAAPMAAQMGIPQAALNFAMMSASGNLFEIESSRLALERSNNPMVRQFAQMMINDHTRMLQQMQALAAQANMTMQPQMTPQHMQMLNSLRNAPMANWNMAYHQAQTMAHQEALALHRAYAANGEVAPLRALAAEAVPVIETHLRELETHRTHWTDQPTQSRTRSGERG